MLKIALTGGICSGKSTVMETWRSLGAPCVDSDDLAHQCLEPGEPTADETIAHFGDRIVTDGRIDRKKLGAIVFADAAKEQREALQDILHPAVRRMWLDWLRRQEADGRKAAVVAVPLLYQTKTESDFDVVVCVSCDRPERLRRLMARGFTENQSNARIDAQDASREALAHVTIYNYEGITPSDLRQQAVRIWEQATIADALVGPNSLNRAMFEAKFGPHGTHSHTYKTVCGCHLGAKDCPRCLTGKYATR